MSPVRNLDFLTGYATRREDSDMCVNDSANKFGFLTG